MAKHAMRFISYTSDDHDERSHGIWTDANPVKFTVHRITRFAWKSRHSYSVSDPRTSKDLLVFQYDGASPYFALPV